MNISVTFILKYFEKCILIQLDSFIHFSVMFILHHYLKVCLWFQKLVQDFCIKKALITLSKGYVHRKDNCQKSSPFPNRPSHQVIVEGTHDSNLYPFQTWAVKRRQARTPSLMTVSLEIGRVFSVFLFISGCKCGTVCVRVLVGEQLFFFSSTNRSWGLMPGCQTWWQAP